MSITSPEELRLPLPGGDTCVLRWPQPGKPTLVFSHATGLCARAYVRLLGRLSGRFEVWAADQRGHGGARAPADPARLHNWHVYADDLVVLSREIAARRTEEGAAGPVVLAGHSMGATVSMLAAARLAPAGFALIEPVIMPAAARLAARTPAWRWMRDAIPLRRAALRRRAEWPSREAARAAYSGKAFFRNWAPEALDGYLHGGLLQEGAGMRLACAPAWEAATFAAQAHDALSAFRKARAPAFVLKAERGSTLPPGPARALTRLGAQVRTLAGGAHMAPMEQPDACTAFLEQAATDAFAQ